MFLPPHLFSALCNLSSFLSFFLLSFLCFIWLFFLFFVSFLRPLTAHSLSSSPFVSLQSFSIFWQSFISVVVLLSTFPGPSYLCHLSPALSRSLSLCLSALICSHLPLTTPLLSCLHFLLPQRTKINVLFSQIAFRK